MVMSQIRSKHGIVAVTKLCTICAISSRMPTMLTCLVVVGGRMTW